jgi:AraC-like DNA-binding protein
MEPPGSSFDFPCAPVPMTPPFRITQPDPVGMSARLLRMLLNYAQFRALDPSSLLEGLGVDLARAFVPEARVDWETMFEAWRRAEQLAEDPAFGLHALEALDSLFSQAVNHGGAILMQLMVTAPTLGTGLEKLARYSPLTFGLGRWACDAEDDTLVARLLLPGSPPRAFVEASCGWPVLAGRALVRPVTPIEVRLTTTGLVSAATHEQVLRCPVRLGAGENAVVFAARDLDVACAGASAARHAALELQAGEALARLLPADSLEAQVRGLLDAEPGTRPPTAERVASVLGISARTFARKLADLGTSYQQIVDQLRAERARRYLVEEGLSVTEVASRLGFSDASAFHRAFRRWFGQSPSEMKGDGPRSGRPPIS